jgi:short-subunit dehydrogenase
VQVDHTDVNAVRSLFERILDEQGQIDILVNSVSGKATNDSFLRSDLEANLDAIWQGGRSHIIATYFAAKRMVEAGSGLIVGVSDHEWDQYYAIEKAIFNRLAISVGEELRPAGVASLALLPGAFFHCFNVVTEKELRLAVESNPNVAKCHTPRLIGRAIVALATDRNVISKAGRLVELKELVSEYGLRDIDGRCDGEMW